MNSLTHPINILFLFFFFISLFQDRSETKDDNNGGRLQSISNFFQNLGSRKSNRSGSDSSSPDSTQREQLPPIENGSHSRLTVNSHSQQASYANSNNHNGKSRSPSSSRLSDNSASISASVHQQRHSHSKENSKSNEDGHPDPKLRRSNNMLSPYLHPKSSQPSSQSPIPPKSPTATSGVSGKPSPASKTEEQLK